MTQCEMCYEMGDYDCKFCSLGNPCLDCDDYDIENDCCKTEGCSNESEE